MSSLPPLASIGVRMVFALLISASALTLLNLAKSGSAAPQEQPVSKPTPIERKPTRRLFENRIPERVPIKVKIKREKERLFRDLNNEKWARDLEIEVKNISDKPIYQLFFYLEVPEAKIADSHQTFSIVFGRAELWVANNRPNADDVPIMPGETKVLAIEDTGIRGWDEARARDLVPRRIHGVRLIFQGLMFGDGTGFEGTTGAPRPRFDSAPYGTAYRTPKVYEPNHSDLGRWAYDVFLLH